MWLEDAPRTGAIRGSRVVHGAGGRPGQRLTPRSARFTRLAGGGTGYSRGVQARWVITETLAVMGAFWLSMLMLVMFGLRSGLDAVAAHAAAALAVGALIATLAPLRPWRCSPRRVRSRRRDRGAVPAHAARAVVRLASTPVTVTAGLAAVSGALAGLGGLAGPMPSMAGLRTDLPDRAEHVRDGEDDRRDGG